MKWLFFCDPWEPLFFLVSYQICRTVTGKSWEGDAALTSLFPEKYVGIAGCKHVRSSWAVPKFQDDEKYVLVSSRTPVLVCDIILQSTGESLPTTCETNGKSGQKLLRFVSVPKATRFLAQFDIFISSSLPGRVQIRWQATPLLITVSVRHG